jgi:cytochrome c1
VDVFNYLNGQGGFMILVFFVVLIVLCKKYKSYRYFKDMEKARKNKQK